MSLRKKPQIKTNNDTKDVDNNAKDVRDKDVDTKDATNTILTHATHAWW